MLNIYLYIYLHVYFLSCMWLPAARMKTVIAKCMNPYLFSAIVKALKLDTIMFGIRSSLQLYKIWVFLQKDRNETKGKEVRTCHVTQLLNLRSNCEFFYVWRNETKRHKHVWFKFISGAYISNIFVFHLGDVLFFCSQAIFSVSHTTQV